MAESFDIEKFIDEIKSVPILWDKRVKNNKFHSKRVDAWKKIGKKFEMSASDAQKNWFKVRSKYINYSKKQLVGDEIDWPYMEAMNFIKPYIGPEKMKLQQDEALKLFQQQWTPPATQQSMKNESDMPSPSTSAQSGPAYESTTNQADQQGSKAKYYAFGKYIGEELSSMSVDDAEELKNNFIFAILQFKNQKT